MKIWFMVLFSSLIITGCSDKQGSKEGEFKNKIEAAAIFTDTSLTPADFGTVATSTTKIYTFKNEGDTSGPGMPTLSNTDFSIVLQTGCSQVLVSKVCTVRINFNPTGKNPGTYTTTLNVGGTTKELSATKAEPITGGTTTTGGTSGSPLNIQASVSGSPVLTPPLDYGSFSGTQSASKIIRLTNKGTSSVGPFSAALSDTDFTFLLNSCTNKILAPNGTCDVRVTFSASGKTAQDYFTNLTFSTFSLSLKSTVLGSSTTSGTSSSGAAIISLNPSTLNFGTLGELNSSQQTVSVKNTGTAASSAITVGAPASFTVLLNGCLNKILAPGASCSVRFSFTGSGKNPGQLYQESIQISDQSLSLQAQMIANVFSLEATPTSLSFGNFVNNGTLIESGTQIVTLKNTGPYSRVIPTPTFSNNLFTISQNSCSGRLLGINNSCTIKVAFTSLGKTNPPGQYNPHVDNLLIGSLTIPLDATTSVEDLICGPGTHLDTAAFECISDTLACTLDNGSGNRQWNGLFTDQVVSLDEIYSPTCIPNACDTAHYIEGNACVSISRPCLPSPKSTSQKIVGQFQPLGPCIGSRNNSFSRLTKSGERLWFEAFNPNLIGMELHSFDGTTMYSEDLTPGYHLYGLEGSGAGSISQDPDNLYVISGRKMARVHRNGVNNYSTSIVKNAIGSITPVGNQISPTVSPAGVYIYSADGLEYISPTGVLQPLGLFGGYQSLSINFPFLKLINGNLYGNIGQVYEPNPCPIGQNCIGAEPAIITPTGFLKFDLAPGNFYFNSGSGQVIPLGNNGELPRQGGGAVTATEFNGSVYFIGKKWTGPTGIGQSLMNIDGGHYILYRFNGTSSITQMTSEGQLGTSFFASNGAQIVGKTSQGLFIQTNANGSIVLFNGSSLVPVYSEGQVSVENDTVYIRTNESIFQWNGSAIITIATLPNLHFVKDFGGGNIFVMGGNERDMFKYNGSTLVKIDLGTPSGGDTAAGVWTAFINGKFFFTANIPNGGQEIVEYHSNGTIIYHDIYPGLNSSSPRELTEFNGDLYFSATDENGSEIWRLNLN